ncbi:helix-turn-helix domain-containing protein [Streptomyces sp. CRN 30]|uniref:AraC-like ligand-binding domain-containing protein n=1 Tax=Streptomyces sp. CRN 30 TaxID=3075613 RepID=UPI002A7FA6B6|nr:helix-turn-helix domain-containing protein [Streptomyces sp. CRN 30]
MTEFSTTVVEPKERFALWEETTARSHMRNRLRSDDQDDFRAGMRVLDLGEVSVSALAYSHLGLVRTPRLVRQSDPEMYQINYLPGGRGRLSLGRHDTRLGPGDLVLLDSSSAYHGDVRASSDDWAHLTVQFPRELLPLPQSTVRRLLAVPIGGHRGMAGVFTRWLADLNARADEFTPADLPTLASVTLDLLASALARCLDADGSLPPESRRRALRTRVFEFAEQRLADPGTTPRTIAEAHHISLRTLQQLFAEDDTSPAAWLRARRLERCRADLADPRGSTDPVQAVAARWGFTDAAHFSRLFRATYGMPPRDYRRARWEERDAEMRE